MSRYQVQILVVKEYEVEAPDTINAEKEAFNMLPFRDKCCALSMRVSEDIYDGGSLADRSNFDNWQFAKNNFYAIDSDAMDD